MLSMRKKILRNIKNEKTFYIEVKTLNKLRALTVSFLHCRIDYADGVQEVLNADLYSYKMYYKEPSPN